MNENKTLKERWIALYVENDVGVLAKVSGLFSGKSYNLQSLTVGTTEREDTSRMTICAQCDDITFEQIKKQLNTMVEDLANGVFHLVNKVTYGPVILELMGANAAAAAVGDSAEPEDEEVKPHSLLIRMMSWLPY